MKTYEELAQSAYDAHQKEGAKQYPGYTPDPWHKAPPQEKAVFIAVAMQLWAEFAAIH
jgi:hypothetical protein